MPCPQPLVGAFSYDNHGHPQWLNIISPNIVELFDGDVILFLQQMGTEIYLGDNETLFSR